MYVIGVDLGGTQMRARLCQSGQKILAERKELVADKSVGAVVEQLARLVEALWVEAQVGPAAFALSCAVAGMLDGEGRVVKNAPNLKWRDAPFASLLEVALPEVERVTLWNDLDAATWGEFVAGAGQHVRDVVAVFAGSGVGGGLVLGGRLHRGSWGVSGEIGHLKVSRNGRLCGCGGHGCVEAYAGGHSIARIAREQVGQSPYLQRRANDLGIDALSPADVAQGAREGDAVCVEIFDRAGDSLGLVISHLVTLTNPAKVILGGGVLMHWSELRERVEERVTYYTSTPASEGLQLVTSELGDDAGLVGAVSLAAQGDATSELLPVAMSKPE